MKYLLIGSLTLAGALVALLPVQAETRIKLGSVAPEYRPTAGPEMPEPVSMQSYSFEVNKETKRARVVVEYTYPDEIAFGADGGLGPEPSLVQVPGLSYDAEASEVVFNDQGKKTVCATVHPTRHLFGKGVSVTPTGSCIVTSALAE